MGLLGDLVEGLTQAVVDGFFFIFEMIAGSMGDILSKQIVDILVGVLFFTPLPKVGAEPAIIREPTNGFWPELWDLYWGTYLPAGLAIGLLFWTIGVFLGTIPWMPAKFRQRLKGGFWRGMIATVLAWPIMATSLFIMDALILLVAPPHDQFEVWVEGIVSAMIITAASPFSIITTAIGLISLTLILALVAIYLIRILYLTFMFGLAPLVVVMWGINLPMASGLAKTLVKYWVRLGIAPMFVAAIMHAGVILMIEPDGSGGYDYRTFEGLAGFGDFGSIFAVALGLVLPLLGIGGFYFAAQAELPAGASRALHAARRRRGGPKRLGQLGKSGSTAAAGGAAGAAAASATGNGGNDDALWRQKYDSSKQKFEYGRSQVVDRPLKGAYKHSGMQRGVNAGIQTYSQGKETIVGSVRERKSSVAQSARGAKKSAYWRANKKIREGLNKDTGPGIHRPARMSDLFDEDWQGGVDPAAAASGTTAASAANSTGSGSQETSESRSGSGSSGTGSSGGADPNIKDDDLSEALEDNGRSGSEGPNSSVDGASNAGTHSGSSAANKISDDTDAQTSPGNVTTDQSAGTDQSASSSDSSRPVDAGTSGMGDPGSSASDTESTGPHDTNTQSTNDGAQTNAANDNEIGTSRVVRGDGKEVQMPDIDAKDVDAEGSDGTLYNTEKYETDVDLVWEQQGEEDN